MIINKLHPEGLYEIIPEPHADRRGFFMRTYDRDIFVKHGIDREWLQENHSRTENAGIIRGLHFQLYPCSETKLVRCIRGRIFDVAVDLRKRSETFGKWLGLELSEDNKKIFFIPRGFAHGFCSLTGIAEVLYKVDNVYSPGHERGIIWNDPDLSIKWPVIDPELSEKDLKNMSLRELLERGELKV
jgi:dTDP-4-dehydrorhamnose 3,5-epimerase